MKKLVKKGESNRLEFKKTTGQRTTAVKTACAMLNSTGGFVIFGVTDKGEITGEITGEVTGEVGTKLAPSRHQVDILHKCRTDTPLPLLMEITGRSDRTKFRNQVLNPLLKDDLIEMTIPDKPRSSKQKYRLTEKGKAWLDMNVDKGK